MKVQAPVPRRTCCAGGGALPRVGFSHWSAEFRSGDAKPAIPLQAFATRPVPPRGMPDAGGMKNVDNPGPFRRRILPQLSKDPHSAKCETVGDLPVLLLFRAIARAHGVPRPRVHGVCQIREYARVHPGYESVRRQPTRRHAGMTAAAKAGADNDPTLLPRLQQGEANTEHLSSRTPPCAPGKVVVLNSPCANPSEA